MQRYHKEFTFFSKKENGTTGISCVRTGRGELEIVRVENPALTINQRLVVTFKRWDLCVEPHMRISAVNEVVGGVPVDTTDDTEKKKKDPKNIGGTVPSPEEVEFALEKALDDAPDGSWVKLRIRRGNVLRIAKEKARAELKRLGKAFAAHAPVPLALLDVTNIAKGLEVFVPQLPPQKYL